MSLSIDPNICACIPVAQMSCVCHSSRLVEKNFELDRKGLVGGHQVTSELLSSFFGYV